MAKATNDPKNQPPKEIRHQQLAMLEDIAGQSLQTRFEDFCRHAVDALIATNEHGNPVFEAGKVSSKFKVAIKVTRTSDDTLTFEFDHKIEESHPKVPGKARSSPLVQNVGLAMRVSVKELPLFDPADGQPTAMEIAEAERTLAKQEDAAAPAPRVDDNGEVIA